MTGVKRTSARANSEPAEGKARAETAFDAFVERGLHELYDRVLSEPIPDELLKLIEDDRSK